MRRPIALLALLLAVMLAGLGLTASAATPNATKCREAAGISSSATPGSVSSGQAFKYDECRFDALEALIKAGQSPTAPPTSSPSATPTASSSPSPSVTPPATPTPTASSTTAPAACSTVKFTGEGSSGVGPATAAEQVKDGGYDISAEQWGVKAGYKSTLRFCSKDNWNVDVTAVDDDGQHAVQSYPSIRRIYHDWGNGGNFTGDPRLSDFGKLAVQFDVRSPATCTGCIYETAFDNWLNGISGQATEQMIWLRNQGQRPYGDVIKTNVSIDGRSWDVWSGNANHVVSFTPAAGQPQIDAGTVDVKAFTAYQVANGLIATSSQSPALPSDYKTNPFVSQVSLGIEPVKTSGQRWDFLGFTLTDH